MSPDESQSTDGERDRLDRWITESERRIDALDAGKLKIYDADEVFRELRERQLPQP